MSERRILIADDEPFISKSLGFILRKEGYEVVVASDGEEALLEAERARPKLIFLDVVMPKMNGYEVCRKLRASYGREVYIIMLTGKGEEESIERAFEAGADECLTKPFSPSEILRKVREVLGEG